MQNLGLPASSSYQQARVAAIETCAWADDLVSGLFVTGFRWEKHLWSWVPRAFAHAARTAAKLRKRTAPTTSPFPNDEGEPESLRHGNATARVDVRSDAVHGREILAEDVGTLDPTTGLRWPQGLACGGPAFLDVGTNIGDWLAPLRAALPPQVPIFGVEGLASNAAVAAANVLAAGLAKEMALIAAADAASSNATGHASSTRPVRTPPRYKRRHHQTTSFRDEFASGRASDTQRRRRVIFDYRRQSWRPGHVWPAQWQGNNCQGSMPAPRARGRYDLGQRPTRCCVRRRRRQRPHHARSTV